MASFTAILPDPGSNPRLHVALRHHVLYPGIFPQSVSILLLGNPALGSVCCLSSPHAPVLHFRGQMTMHRRQQEDETLTFGAPGCSGRCCSLSVRCGPRRPRAASRAPGKTRTLGPRIMGWLHPHSSAHLNHAFALSLASALPPLSLHQDQSIWIRSLNMLSLAFE